MKRSRCCAGMVLYTKLSANILHLGFMKQLPNLLKQESSSASTLVNVLLRMFPHDMGAQTSSHVSATIRHMLSDLRDKLFQDIMPCGNVIAWTPVVTEILHGCCTFENESVSNSKNWSGSETDATFEQFSAYLPELYPLVTDMLAREMAVELLHAVRQFYVKTGEVKELIPQE
jgi:brefeldin A-inhibited guanine nucleotide-exchange protein